MLKQARSVEAVNEGSHDLVVVVQLHPVTAKATTSARAIETADHPPTALVVTMTAHQIATSLLATSEIEKAEIANTAAIGTKR